jgi:hypothetical protein
MSVKPPYQMAYGKQAIHTIRVNKGCSEAMLEALNGILKLYGTQADIEAHNLHHFGGCYNFRLEARRRVSERPCLRRGHRPRSRAQPVPHQVVRHAQGSGEDLHRPGGRSWRALEPAGRDAHAVRTGALMVSRILSPAEATALQTALNQHSARLVVDGHWGELSACP